MSDTKNLWGDLIMSPASIPEYTRLMREQADLLKTQTQGILLGELFQSSDNGIYSYRFNICAPKLKSYRYELFQAMVGFYPYPVFLYENSVCIPDWNNGDLSDHHLDTILAISPTENKNVMSPTYKAKTYEEFEKYLAKILQSDSTKEVIETLLVKSQSILLNKL